MGQIWAAAARTGRGLVPGRHWAGPAARPHARRGHVGGELALGRLRCGEAGEKLVRVHLNGRGPLAGSLTCGSTAGSSPSSRPRQRRKRRRGRELAGARSGGSGHLRRLPGLRRAREDGPRPPGDPVSAGERQTERVLGRGRNRRWRGSTRRGRHEEEEMEHGVSWRW